MMIKVNSRFEKAAAHKERYENLSERSAISRLDDQDRIYHVTDLDWLHNGNLYDIEWNIKPHMHGNERSSWKVTWQPVHADGKMQIFWQDWRRYGQRVMFWLMHHPKRKPLSPGSICAYSREVRAICEWFCFERRVASVSEVRHEDVDAFLVYVESLQLKFSSVQTKLLLISQLNQLKFLIGEGLSFAPFRRAGSLTKIAKKISLPRGHTPTIYPKDFFELLNSALVMIDRSDGLLERLAFYMDLRSSGNARPSREFKRKYGESLRELQSDCRALYGACLIILFALWGERKHELLNSPVNIVTQFLRSGGDQVNGVEYKTSGTWTGKSTQRAAIKEVRTSLDIISKLTVWGRNEVGVGDEWFFIKLSFGHSANANPQKYITTRSLYSLLDAFANRFGFDIKLRPHMFRRSFAMLWAWRFEIGDLELLSKLLYHNSEYYTRFYTEDEDIWEFLPEAERELAFTIIHEGLTGSRKIAGALGPLLERYKRRLIAKVGVMSPSKAERFARRLLDEGGYRAIGNTDGYCFINEARGHRAKCSVDGFNPNYANRNEELCASCPNFGVSDSRVDYWKERRLAHENVLRSTSVPMLADAAIRGISRADTIIKKIG